MLLIFLSTSCLGVVPATNIIYTCQTVQQIDVMRRLLLFGFGFYSPHEQDIDRRPIRGVAEPLTRPSMHACLSPGPPLPVPVSVTSPSPPPTARSASAVCLPSFLSIPAALLSDHCRLFQALLFPHSSSVDPHYGWIKVDIARGKEEEIALRKMAQPVS